MRKGVLVALIAIAGLGVLALVLLQSYKTPLIHSIVLNATLQKAPAGYPEESIQEAFQEAYAVAQEQNREREYLELLLKLSQRLEKVQVLEAAAMDSMLEELRREAAAE